MGQHFRPVIELNDGTQYSIRRHGAGRFTDCSVLHNPVVMLTYKHLARISEQGNTFRYTLAGEYSIKWSGYYDILPNEEVSEHISRACNNINQSSQARSYLVEQTNELFLFNHSKKEMVSLGDFIKQRYTTEPECRSGEKVFHVSPLDYLCCTEQQLGGGDYNHFFRGSSLENGGSWVGGDLTIGSSNRAGYNDITGNLILSWDLKEHDLVVDELDEPPIDLMSFGQF